MKFNTNYSPTPGELFNKKVALALDTGIEAKNKKQTRRKYLGPSAIGRDCQREVQYGYMGQPKDFDFQGKTLRIFDFGHKSEELMVDWMRTGGIILQDVNPKTGKQWEFTLNVGKEGKVSGHCDGIIKGIENWVQDGDIIEEYMHGFPCLWEAKSMKNSKFNEFKKKGVKQSHFGYYVQVQLYMAFMKLTDNLCWFTVVNKDTAEVWHEFVGYDAEVAQQYSDRAFEIITATERGELLPRSFNDPSYFQCKWCDYRKTCWGERAI